MKIMKAHTRSSILLALSLLSFVYIFIFLEEKTTFNSKPILYTKKLFTALTRSLHSDEAHSHCRSRACPNVARVGTVGYWRMRKEVGKEEIDSREKMDKEMRVETHWPESLYRNDSRCGMKFPIPGFRVQGTCDPTSKTPCCHHPSGLCSDRPEHCNCSECTDFRTKISAELAEWVPSDTSCVVKNFTQAMTCDILNRFNISIAFIGDSLIRQLSETLLLFLTGNPHSGLLPPHTSQSDRNNCHDDHQITKIACARVTAHSVEKLGPNSVCKGRVNFEWALVENYGTNLLPNSLRKITEYLGRNNSFVVLTVGLHLKLDFEAVLEKFVRKILRMIETKGNGWPKIIWMGIHAVPGYLRTASSFSNKGLSKFNNKMHGYLERRNVTVIDTFELTRHLKSFDGLHYGMGANYQKVHILLNHIEEFYNTC